MDFFYDLYDYILIVGIIAYLSVIFSFLTGKGILKVRLKVHKILGFTSLAIASIHGLYMLLYNFL